MGHGSVILANPSAGLIPCDQVISMHGPRWLAAALCALFLAGCARPAPTGTSAPGATAPAAGSPGAAPTPVSPGVPGPADAGDPSALNLQERAAWLERYLNAGQGPALPRLQALLDHWFPVSPGVQPDPNRLSQRSVEADLDGDGTPELATVINVADRKGQLQGAVYVLYRDGGRYRADMSPPPDLPNLQLVTAADLRGDGRRQLVWMSSDHGAHTEYLDLFVADWRPGALQVLPGPVHMDTPTRVALEGREIVLGGGLIGSAGAGATQRPWTDRYRLIGGVVRLSDRRYDASAFAYHRLIDGITAETYSHTEDALQAYRDATDPQRAAIAPGAVEPAHVADFAAAVRALARFRLGALLLQQGQGAAAQQALAAAAAGSYAGLSQALRDAGAPEKGCAAAAAWAKANPGFLTALNRPFGYANPRWAAPDLCGGLPSAG